MAKTIAVDFDGVIHAYSKGWQDGTIYDGPVDGAIDALRELMKSAAVFVHTTRAAEPVVMWLVDYGLDACTEETAKADGWAGEFWNDQTTLLVTSRKLPAVCYLDDRAVRFFSWLRALDDLHLHLMGATP